VSKKLVEREGWFIEGSPMPVSRKSRVKLGNYSARKSKEWGEEVYGVHSWYESSKRFSTKPTGYVPMRLLKRKKYKMYVSVQD